MITRIKKLPILAVTITAALLAFFPTHEANAEPGRDRIIRAVEALAGPGLTVDSIEFKVFTEAEGRGRVSAKGVLVAIEPRVEWEKRRGPKFNLLQQRLAQSGISPQAFHRYRRLAGLRNFGGLSFYRVVINVGVSTPFTSEWTWFETVEGYKFTGDVDHDFCCTPVSELEESNVVAGTEQFEAVVESLLSWYRHEMERLPASVASLFNPLSDGATLYDGEKPVAALSPILPATSSWRFEDWAGGNFVWVTDVQTKVTSLSHKTVQIAQTTLEPGQTANLEVNLFVDYRGAGTNDACIGLGAEGWSVHGYSCLTSDAAFDRPYRAQQGLRDYIRKISYRLIPGVPGEDELARIEARADGEEAKAAAANAAQAERAAKAKANFAGAWRTENGALALDIDKHGTTKIISGGSGNRPNGSTLMQIEAVEGDRFTGVQKFSNGGWVSIRGKLDGNRLDMSGGGFSWSWLRIDG